LINRSTRVAKVGWKEWAPLADVPVFKGVLAGRRAAAEAVAKVAYAGFWIRLGAFTLDYIIFIVVFMLAALAAFAAMFLIAGSMAAAIERMRTLNVLLAVVGSSLGFFYYVYFQRSPWQATPGKRLCGIHITRADGGRVDGWLALGRTFAYTLSLIPLGIGYLMIGWTDQKKGLHDIVCDTRVVYGTL
jgi:uncharacterized RDD family membrane protein YckC